MNMKRFTEFTHNLSGAMMLIGQTLISAFFVIIILCLVLFVEIQRVAHGIQLFEQSPQSAYTGAFVLVMMLLTLEFVIHYIETKSGYHQEQKRDFSLRIVCQWLAYFVGYGDSWQARLKSPAQSIKSYSRLLTVTILALALGGSMSDALATVQGNWMQGLQTIILESSLLEIVEWGGGLLFALALVVGAQRLTAYVAQRASETLISADTHADISVQTISKKDQDTEPVIHIVEPDIYLLDAEHPEYKVTCDCGWERTYDNADSSQRGLSAHQQKCSIYQEYAKNEQLVEVTS